MNLDLQLLRLLNSLVIDKGFCYHIASIFVSNAFLLGAPVFAALAFLSLSQISSLNKSKIILGYIGVAISVVLSVYCQTYLNIHIRPLFDHALNLPKIVEWPTRAFGKRIYSLPSDTATLYFAICSIIFIQNKKIGILCFTWIALTVGLSRVSLGAHYPSDILAGLILGYSVVYTVTNIKSAQNQIQKLIVKYDTKSNIFNIIVVLFCAESYSQFSNLQPIYESLLHFISAPQGFIR